MRHLNRTSDNEYGIFNAKGGELIIIMIHELNNRVSYMG